MGSRYQDNRHHWIRQCGRFRQGIYSSIELVSLHRRNITYTLVPNISIMCGYDQFLAQEVNKILLRATIYAY